MLKDNGVICFRVKDVPAGRLTPGTKKKHCSLCSEEVWISLATARVQESKNSDVYCVQCFTKEKGDTNYKIAITEEQIEETKQELRDRRMRN